MKANNMIATQNVGPPGSVTNQNGPNGIGNLLYKQNQRTPQAQNINVLNPISMQQIKNKELAGMMNANIQYKRDIR
jgi:hypothetical protein